MLTCLQDQVLQFLQAIILPQVQAFFHQVQILLYQVQTMIYQVQAISSKVQAHIYQCEVIIYKVQARLYQCQYTIYQVQSPLQAEVPQHHRAQVLNYPDSQFLQCLQAHVIP